MRHEKGAGSSPPPADGFGGRFWIPSFDMSENVGREVAGQRRGIRDPFVEVPGRYEPRHRPQKGSQSWASAGGVDQLQKVNRRGDHGFDILRSLRDPGQLAEASDYQWVGV